MAGDEVGDENTEASTTARQLLVEWANKQDGWVRKLVVEVLASGKPAGPDAIDGIYAHYLAEKDLSDERASAIPALEYQDELDPGWGVFVFRKLEGVRGVNALSAGQAIEFNPGLTILFGENGAGKTGYARILKALADVRTAEPILPNVHEPAAPAAQHATVAYAVGEDEFTLEWAGERGVSPMTHVSVFDSPAVRLHVDDDLAYVYTPRDLALFAAVSEGIDEVKSRAEADTAAKQPGTNPYLTHFQRGTPVYTLLETLGPATDLAELRDLADVSDEETAKAELLQTSVSAMQSDALPAQVSGARDRVQLYESLRDAAQAAGRFDATAYNAAVAAAKQAEAAYGELRTSLLESVGITDRGEDAWQSFVLQGEAYREHVAPDHYPAEGEPCLYCRQPLNADAAKLLERYRDFATDATRQRIDDARAQTQFLTRGLAALDRTALLADVARHLQDHADDDTLSKAKTLIEAIDGQAAGWQAGDAVDWSAVDAAAGSVERDSEARRAAAQSLVDDLTKRSADRATRLEEDSALLRQLEARIELKKRLPDLETFVADAKWSQRLSQLVKKMQPLAKSLTDVSKVASERLLNADFERRFREECAVLRAPKVGLQFPGRRGKAARRKVVSADHRPSEVLSEGEQKVIALADFLAEAALRLIPAPVIFDDPVNSLDYRRIHEVAERIARLAEARQVIVFTHSIWLTTELLAYFEKNRDRCTYYSVTDEGGKGVVVRGTHPRWDTVGQTTKKINGLVEAAKRAEGDAREAIVEAAYSRIRTWCEVVVETELLKGVTQRYQPHVAMTLLPQIKGDRLAEATEVINPVYAKACRVMDGHSQPLETLSVRPTLEELEREWAEVQAARAAYLA